MPLRMVFISDGVVVVIRIDLVTVVNAILTSRQTREKLQCFYENLMSNNFRKTDFLEKKMNCKLKLHSKGFYQRILGAVTVLKFLQKLVLDFPYICLQFFLGNFCLLAHVTPSNFCSRILKSEALVYSSYIF